MIPANCWLEREADPPKVARFSYLSLFDWLIFLIIANSKKKTIDCIFFREIKLFDISNERFNCLFEKQPIYNNKTVE